MRLAVGVVRLHLQVVAVLERFGVPGGRFPGALRVVGRQVARDLTRHAGGAHDQPPRVAGQHFPVHTRAVVEALRVSDGRQLYQVLVALHVPGQNHEVVVGPFSLAGFGAVSAVAGRDVGLHADDRLEAGGAGLFLEGPHAEQAPVVRERERRHLELLGLPDQVRDAIRAVE